MRIERRIGQLKDSFFTILIAKLKKGSNLSLSSLEIIWTRYFHSKLPGFQLTLLIVMPYFNVFVNCVTFAFPVIYD